MRQLITAQLGITMPCLLRFIDANQPGKDTLVPKKQEVKLNENLSKVQARWQFIQFTKSPWGRLSKLVCDSDNMELIFFISSLSSGWRSLWWYYDDPFYSIRPHTLFPVMSLITPSVWYSFSWHAASSFTSSSILSTDHTQSFSHTHGRSLISSQLQIIIRT